MTTEVKDDTAKYRLDWDEINAKAKIRTAKHISEIFPQMQKSLFFGIYDEMNRLEMIKQIREKRAGHTCNHWDCKKPASFVFSQEVFDNPYEKEGQIKSYCSEEHMDEDLFQKGDFDYFICHKCQRTVCGQAPSNGWHTQSREIDDELYCLPCYEEILVERGLTDEEINKLRGTFGIGDVAEKAGYEKKDDIFVSFVNKKHVIGLIRKYLPNKIVIEYYDMGYGGTEGTITLWVKNEQRKEE